MDGNKKRTIGGRKYADPWESAYNYKGSGISILIL